MKPVEADQWTIATNEDVIEELLDDGWLLYGTPFSHGGLICQALIVVPTYI